MSLDIDMNSYAGEFSNPAAGDQAIETNLYEGQPEFPVNDDLLDAAPQADLPPQEAEKNPQANHFRALREEVDRIKAEKDTERREYQAQLDMLKANLAQSNRQHEPVAQERKMFEGMDDSDVPNVRELRTEWESRESAYQSRIEELQVAQMHPDYAEVIEKYAIPLVHQKPHLAEGLQGAKNKALFAYELGKMAQQMQAHAAPQEPARPSENAQRMVENARKPGTLSQTGGQAALSKADYFASMSDAEFVKFASKNLEQI